MLLISTHATIVTKINKKCQFTFCSVYVSPFCFGSDIFLTSIQVVKEQPRTYSGKIVGHILRHTATKFAKLKPGEETAREALYKDELKEIFEDHHNSPLDEVPVPESPIEALQKNNLTQMPDDLDPIAT